MRYTRHQKHIHVNMDSKKILQNFFDKSKIDECLSTENFRKEAPVDISDKVLAELLDAVRSQHGKHTELIVENITNEFETDKSVLVRSKDSKLAGIDHYSLSELVEKLNIAKDECCVHDSVLTKKILNQIQSLESRIQGLQSLLAESVKGTDPLSISPKFVKCANLVDVIKGRND